MTSKVLFAVLAFLAAGTALPSLHAAERRIVGEATPAPAHGLVASHRLEATNQLRLTISLPLRRQGELTQLLKDLYDPASPNYRRYLTAPEFAERFGPTREDYALLKEFAQANGFRVVGEHPNRTLLNIEGAVPDIERTFQTTLRVYPHPTEGRSFYSPDSGLSIAAGLPILDVSGLNNYHVPRPKSLHAQPAEAKGHSLAKTGSGPSGNYIGSDFRAAYVPNVTLTGAGQTLGLLEFDGYFASDIVAYTNKAQLRAFPPVQPVLIDGFSGVPAAHNNNTVEVSLDIELAGAMAPGLAAILVYEAPTNGLNAHDVLNRMATDNLAKQLSTSWDFLATTPASIDQIFQQFAVQGQSFFDASGDNGAYPGTIPAPDDDPYITVVGGTTLTTGTGGAWASETVWNWFTTGTGSGASGGGISTTYPIPYWQQGISMSANQGSTTKRNVPDVALTADNIWVTYNNGKAGSFGGTSCAAPLWAGFTALVNQQAMATTGATVGFLNPSLYGIGMGAGYGAAFHDIKTGNSFPTTGSTKYVAVAGYDLCTGWGTPVGQGLINTLAAQANALLVIPTNGFTASGAVGGPFSPASQVFTLTNFGTATLSWTIINTNPWLTALPAAGILTPASPTAAVTLALNGAATHLPAGAYAGSIQVSNTTAGVVAQTSSFALLAGQNIVLNGGFETGDFTDWTLQGSTLDNHVTGSTAYPAHPELVHSGLYGALVGQVLALGYLSQTLPTVPGQLYLLSFWVTSPYFSDSDTPNEFLVGWGPSTNATTALYDQVNQPPFNWTNMQFAVTATESSTMLVFGARNDPHQFGLDDISVVPISPPNFQGLTVSNAVVGLAWSTIPGLVYQVQYTTNLTGGAWNNLGGAVTATTTTTSQSEAQPADRFRFYRVVLSP